MSSVTETVPYGEDAELIWQAALHYVAARGYTIHERVEATRLVCRTPAASLVRSAGQVIAISVRPTGPRQAELAIRVSSFDERREPWFWPWLLRVPRQQLIDELKGGISRLLPVIGLSAPGTPRPGPGVGGLRSPAATDTAHAGDGSSG